MTKLVHIEPPEPELSDNLQSSSHVPIDLYGLRCAFEESLIGVWGVGQKQWIFGQDKNSISVSLESVFNYSLHVRIVCLSTDCIVVIVSTGRVLDTIQWSI